MITRTDITFELTATDQPLVTRHEDGTVALHISSVHGGTGFSIQFSRKHLPVVQTIVNLLEFGD